MTSGASCQMNGSRLLFCWYHPKAFFHHLSSASMEDYGLLAGLFLQSSDTRIRVKVYSSVEMPRTLHSLIAVSRLCTGVTTSLKPPRWVLKAGCQYRETFLVNTETRPLKMLYFFCSTQLNPTSTWVGQKSSLASAVSRHRLAYSRPSVARRVLPTCGSGVWCRPGWSLSVVLTICCQCK